MRKALVIICLSNVFDKTHFASRNLPHYIAFLLSTSFRDTNCCVCAWNYHFYDVVPYTRRRAKLIIIGKVLLVLLFERSSQRMETFPITRRLPAREK